MVVPGKVVSLFAATLVALSSLSLVSGIGPIHYGEPVLTTTNTYAYSQGESVQVCVAVVGPISASFSSTCQCFFVVEDSSGNVAYDLRNHTFWFQVLTGLTAPPTKYFNFTWNQKDDAGNQVKPGSYIVWGYVAGYTPMDSPVAGDSTPISIGDEPVFEVALVKGWNLFSLPLVASNYTSDSLGLPSGSVVVRWDSTTQSYDSVFVVGMSPPSDAFTLTEGSGYWVFASANCTVAIYGGVLTTTHYYQYVIPAGGGWALVGFPLTNGTWHASDIAGWSNTLDSVEIVCRYDESTATYATYIVGLPMTDFGLTPGEGYWVFLNENVTVSYGP